MDQKRKKRTSSEEVTEKIVLEDLYDEENKPFEEVAEEDPDKTVKIDVKALEAEKPAKRTKRSKTKASKPTKRSSRAKKQVEPQIWEDENSIDEATETGELDTDDLLDLYQEEEPPKRTNSPRKKAKPLPRVSTGLSNESPDLSEAHAAFVQSLDGMMQQFNSVSETNNAVSANLEKLVLQLRSSNDAPQPPAQKPEEVLPAQPPAPPVKHSASHKLAFGLSLIALVLSLISLAFSQSVRQNVLNQPMLQARPAQHVRTGAPAIAKTTPITAITPKVLKKQKRKKKPVRRNTKRRSRRR